ncbi:MAG: PilZ domain-containing protein [Thermodesulfobacteriota bacterium]
MDTLEERRKHKRFQAQDNVLALNALSFGQVINMSMGGLRIKYLLRRNDPFHKSFEISLLNNSADHYIDKLSCKVVNITDSGPICPPLNLFIREAGVMFLGLTPAQKDLLDHFLIYNSVPSA